MASLDPTRLTAYLDDELPGPERLALEAELRDQPALQSELEELRVSRQWLRDLPRPVAPRDVALDVVRAIETRGIQAPRPHAVRPTGRGPWLVLGTLGSVAAGLLLVWLSHVFDPNPAGPSMARTQTPRAPRRDVPSPPIDAAPIAGTLVADAPAPAPAVDVTSPTPIEDLLAEEDRVLAGRARLEEILGLGEPRRIVVAVDHLDADALERVDTAIETSARSDARHARFRVEDALRFDAGRPGPAVVYALPLRRPEARLLTGRLQALLPGRVEPEGPVEPALVAALSEVRGHVAYHESTPHAIVRSERPPAGDADSRTQAKVDGPAPTIPPSTPGDPFRDAPVVLPRPVEPASPRAAADEDEDGVYTYLIWLTGRTPTR